MTLARSRQILDWHEHPGLIGWAATPTGRLALWAAAAVLLPSRFRLLVLPLLALALVFPARRVDLLALGALATAYRFLPGAARAGPFFKVAGILLMLALVALVVRAARDFRRLPRPAQRHPFVILHAALYGTLALSYLLPVARGTFFAALVTTYQKVGPFLVWRLSYVVLSGKRGSAAKSRFRDHFFYCFPIWGGTNTPTGKGYDYFRQTRVDAPEEIAAARLSGLKLLGLAWIWTGFRDLLFTVVRGEGAPRVAALLGGWNLGVPALSAAIAAAGTRQWAAGTLWASLGIELIVGTLRWAIAGHFAVGVLRLFGFRMFRNTYKPLLSTTLVDFWNRYYYYFKELLVEFFFFPTYVKAFKTRPRLRIFAATMAAACAGNFYYHVMRDFRHLSLMPPAVAASWVASRALYSFLLGLGIFVSMLRERERRGKPSPPDLRWPALRRLRAMAGVWLFFSLIHVWGTGPLELEFGKRARFFGSLFGFSPTRSRTVDSTAASHPGAIPVLPPARAQGREGTGTDTEPRLQAAPGRAARFSDLRRRG